MMSISARDRNMIIGAVVAAIAVGIVAFLVGRGCAGENDDAVTTPARTATTQTSTGVTAAIPEPEPVPTPAPAPAPAPPDVPLEIGDASWACADFSSTPGNEGCVAGTAVDWMALIAGDVISVTVTITGPEPDRTLSLTKSGLHDPGSTAIEWYVTAAAPLTPGGYNYYFTITETGGATTVLGEDPIMGPYTLPVASP